MTRGMVVESMIFYLQESKNDKNGAEGENRTRTSVKKPDFESGASTNSATPAQAVKYSRFYFYGK